MSAPPEANAGTAVLRRAAWVGGVVLATWFACFRFPRFWLASGIGEAQRPFMDLYGLLAASDAALAGVDPFRPNAFDPYHRPHVYTDAWLELGRLGLTRADTLWLGTLLVLATLAIAVLMAKPRTRIQGVLLGLLLVSPAFLLAVNRANNDLVVFGLMSVGLLGLRCGSLAPRLLGVLLFAVAAVLKYFPLAAAVVLLDFRSRRDLALALGLYAAVVALHVPGLVPGLASAARHLPQPDGLYAFGAPVFLRNLGIAGQWPWLLPAVGLVAWAGVSAWRRLRLEAPAGFAGPRAAERDFVAGAVMIVGLFFLSSSFVYKLVFAVWLLPWLWSVDDNPAEARWRRWTLGLLLAVVWFEGAMALVLNLVVTPWSEPVALALLGGVLGISQFLTWAWIACLLRATFVMVGRMLAAFRPA